MEQVYAGWLIKSPPENISQGPWKWFKSKWRRRYFVLYAACSGLGLASSSSAVALLCYYSDTELTEKHGSIDLRHCMEIHTHLQVSDYQFVFAVKTQQEAVEQTYCLAAESQPEMNAWVKHLNSVLCLGDSGFDQIPIYKVNEQEQFPSFVTLPRGVAISPKKDVKDQTSVTVFNKATRKSLTEIVSKQNQKDNSLTLTLSRGNTLKKFSLAAIAQNLQKVCNLPRKPPRSLSRVDHTDGESVKSPTPSIAQSEGGMPLFNSGYTSATESDLDDVSCISIKQFGTDYEASLASRRNSCVSEYDNNGECIYDAPMTFLHLESCRSLSLPPIPPQCENAVSRSRKLDLAVVIMETQASQGSYLRVSSPSDGVCSQFEEFTLKEMNESSENESISQSSTFPLLSLSRPLKDFENPDDVFESLQSDQHDDDAINPLYDTLPGDTSSSNAVYIRKIPDFTDEVLTAGSDSSACDCLPSDRHRLESSQGSNGEGDNENYDFLPPTLRLRPLRFNQDSSADLYDTLSSQPDAVSSPVSNHLEDEKILEESINASDLLQEDKVESSDGERHSNSAGHKLSKEGCDDEQGDSYDYLFPRPVFPPRSIVSSAMITPAAQFNLDCESENIELLMEGSRRKPPIVAKVRNRTAASEKDNVSSFRKQSKIVDSPIEETIKLDTRDIRMLGRTSETSNENDTLNGTVSSEVMGNKPCSSDYQIRDDQNSDAQKCSSEKDETTLLDKASANDDSTAVNASLLAIQEEENRHPHGMNQGTSGFKKGLEYHVTTNKYIMTGCRNVRVPGLRKKTNTVTDSSPIKSDTPPAIDGLIPIKFTAHSRSFKRRGQGVRRIMESVRHEARQLEPVNCSKQEDLESAIANNNSRPNIPVKPLDKYLAPFTTGTGPTSPEQNQLD